MKTSFYYRTIDEFSAAQLLIHDTNKMIMDRKHIRFSPISLSTKYINGEFRSNVNIPKHKPGKKKYLAVAHANKSLLDSINVNLPGILMKNGFELAPRVNSEPKHVYKKTTKNIKLQSHTELMAIASVFNKAFGHGNWRIRGPKHMKKILNNIELSKESNAISFGNSWYENQYPTGVAVKIVVNQKDADIDKYLFKVKLKV